MRSIFTLLLCAFYLVSYSQGKWLTDYNEAVTESKKTDKKILMELGAVVNEFALFIPDEEWNNDSVQYYLYDYVPTSILLKERDPLINKFNISFSPTLLIISENGNILYKQSGTLVAEQLTSLLKFINQETENIDFLLSTYRKEKSTVAYLRKAEELLYLTTIAPEVCQEYYLGYTEHQLAKLSQEIKNMDAQYKERFQIISSAFDYIKWQDQRSASKLEDIAKNEVDELNRSLLAYYSYYYAASNRNFDSAVEIARQLETKQDSIPQGKEYSSRIKQLALSSY